MFSTRIQVTASVLRAAVLAVCWTAGMGSALAQDLKSLVPGYERFQKMSRAETNAVVLGSLTVTWKENGQAFEYDKEAKRYRYDIATNHVTELGPARPGGRRPSAGGRRDRTRGPGRGRQFSSALSPDGRLKAFYRDRNLWLSDTNGKNEISITLDGCDTNRIKYGTASWVYGEELDQNTAMWWNTNSEKLAFYRFDERQVRDYYVFRTQVELQNKPDAEPYPKVGTPNPIVDLLIYDTNTKGTVRVDVRDGKPFDDSVAGHYVYGISWTSDGKELLFHRTNRRQNVLELCAADPESGKCRVIVHEEWPASWVENSPRMQFLTDGRRFIWESERTGWKNYYLYDLSGKLLAKLTQHPFEVEDIVQVDEKAGQIYYRAHSGDNPLKLQLHRAALDGSGGPRLTDPAFHHSIDFAPDNRHFIDVEQTHDQPPFTVLRNADGKLVAELARSDSSHAKALGLKPVELFSFKAADGQTDLYGLLHFPSDFNPRRSYPLLVSVYGGPGTVGARETFTLPNILTEYGFLVATLDSRSASGRGKRFLDAIYGKLGTVEIDDQAWGVKALGRRRYVDKAHVGIFGTSYGGTASAMCLLRYPDVFRAAASSSPVTDYRNYDTIYAERYMGLPRDNQGGYKAGTIMTYAEQLKGRLMLYYGTADDNVHPSNALQLIQALQRAGKSFEVQVGPDLGHTGVNRDRMMEFFVANLKGK